MRKRILLISLLLLIGFGAFLYLYNDGAMYKKLAGKGIAEGVIEYDITYPKLDPNSMMISGMPNKAYLRFKDNNTSNGMSGMMGLVSITYIANHAKKSVEQTLTLINKKYASHIPAEDLQRLNDSYVESIDKGKKKREIAGYKCKEITVKLMNGEKTTAYYTDDIDILNPNWANPYSKIEGVLMDFHMERYGISMHLIARAVTPEKVDSDTFEISDDHKIIPYAELEKILVELNPSSD